MEGHNHEAGHVERGKHRSGERHHPIHGVEPGVRSILRSGHGAGHPDDLVLTEEAGERPNSSDGKGGETHRDPRDGHVLP